ncbi:MAG: ROK family protein, partial [Candidatus Saccharibacteria bacterium]|nr:ROK family protein [Pseudorhodobacter sp.]
RIRAAVATGEGRLLTRAGARTPARGTGEAVVQAGAEAGMQALAGQDRAQILAAGAGAPGPLDAARGIAQATPTIDGFRDFPIRDRIAEAIGLPTYLEHDGHAAAYGEWVHGAGRGTANMVFVTVSTGIGGGAIVDGRLQHGRRGQSAHVGHMTLLPDGPVCNCGNLGCWEALAAGPAFAQAARAAGYADGAAVFAAAAMGQAAALQVVDAQARWLAIGLGNLAHIYAPEILIMGGGVAAGLEQMRPVMEAEFFRRAMSPFRDIPIVRAALRDDAGLIGAAALCLAQAVRQA